VIILDTDSVPVTIHPRQWLTGDEELDRVMRPLLISVIERYMPKTVAHYEKSISLFNSEGGDKIKGHPTRRQVIWSQCSDPLLGRDEVMRTNAKATFPGFSANAYIAFFNP
jgi:hypothetical protein